MLRPVKTDLLRDISRDIALNNHGFLYVDDHETELKTEYENRDDRAFNVGSFSTSELREGLSQIAEESAGVTERRGGTAYYFDPFSTPQGGEMVVNQLEQVFQSNLVVTKQQFRSDFELAPKDVDFFVDELLKQEYIRQIAGEHFTVGSSLEDETQGKTSVANQLQRGANRGDRDGRIDHDELERVIDVAATEEVIRYLVDNEFIIDLDGKYLVTGAIDQFGSHLADEFDDDVIAEFEDSAGVMTRQEFEQVVRNQINAYTNVLSKVDPTTDEEIVDKTMSALCENTSIAIDVGSDVAVLEETFDSLVDERARTVFRKIEENYDGPVPSPSAYHERGHPEIGELNVTSESANDYFKQAVKDRFDELVEETFDTSETEGEER